MRMRAASIVVCSVSIVLASCDARLRPIDQDVYYVEGAPGTPNQLVLKTGYGPVVVDAQLDPYLTDRMLAAIRKATGWEDAAYVVNTSGLPYRWLTNYRFARAEIVASSATRRFMVENAQVFVNEIHLSGHAPAWAGEVNPVFPTMDFERRLVLRTPDMSIIILEEPAAVVPGNCVVYVPEKRLLYGGDLITEGTAPVLRYADPGAWVEALEDLRRLPLSIVVPGFGQAGGVALIDKAASAVKALQRYDGGPPPSEVASLWAQDPALSAKLKELGAARLARAGALPAPSESQKPRSYFGK
jgi:glyoxylase-like metal-dependent hydrolase (beta-lactamase superfamily II)